MNGTWNTCHRCKTLMWIPEPLNTAALASPGVISFHCAYGHGQVYAKGETEEDKLRRELQRSQQRLAEKDDEIRAQRDSREATERQLAAQKGVVTRIKNRVGHGVCPCCTRSFNDVARHMKSKHPDYAKSDVILAPEQSP